MIVRRVCNGSSSVRAWEGEPWRSRLVGWTREACGSNEMRVWREFYADGREVFVAVCEGCGRRAGELPQRALTERQRDYARQLTDVRVDRRASSPKCMFEGCDRPSQRHHYAPRSVFGYPMADHFGTVPLCIEHHTLWHRVMDGKSDERRAAA